MDYEKKYNRLLEETKKVKKLYLKQALIKENKELLKKIGGPFIKDEEYKKEIVNYWENFNYIPKKFWFDIYCNRDKRINKYMLPADLYYNDIIPYLNNLSFWNALADKNYIDVLFGDVNRPKTICKNINGFYYDDRNRLIKETEAIDILYNYKKEFIIKPTIDTSMGKNIIIIEDGFNNKKEVKAIFDTYNKNFICQETIKQHKDLSSLNPDCVNTIRVMSLLYNNKVYNVSCVIRVGDRNTTYLKTVKGNVTQGIGLEVLENGRLAKKGIYKSGKWIEDDYYGNKLSSHIVPSMKKIQDLTKEIHIRVPHFKCIGWDFSVDVNGNPVLIELNVSPGINVQLMTGKPVFGKLTPIVLEKYFKGETF